MLSINTGRLARTDAEMSMITAEMSIGRQPNSCVTFATAYVVLRGILSQRIRPDRYRGRACIRKTVSSAKVAANV